VAPGVTGEKQMDAPRMSPELAQKLTKELINKGQLIQAGWVGFRYSAIPENAPDFQVEDMRNAFFAGSQHLFASIVTILDPGDEPTENDTKVLDSIHSELMAFFKEFEFKYLKTRGNA
jgi:hypothetical protein